MAELPIGEPLETKIHEPDDCLARLDAGEDPSAVAARRPDCLAAWAALGEAALAGGRPVDAYAYFRVGYHRGLDRLRKEGWRGSGRVPWDHVANRGFLRSLRGLGVAAAELGEDAEAERCRDFFEQLAPDAP